MADNIYEKIHKALTWKRIIAFNMLLFMVTAIPLSVRLTQQEADNRSGAAEEAPVVTPPPSYPSAPPAIDRVSEFFGKKGDTIVILGSNFGDYKWGSRVYVGNVEASDDDLVRWSNTVIEVQIPEGARTGKVWVIVDGKQSIWEGSLLLYDVSRAAQIGIKKSEPTSGAIWVANGSLVVRGMIEIGHVGEITEIEILGGRAISQSSTVDGLGKKTKIEFGLNTPLTSVSTEIAKINYSGIGNLEIIRMELYDQSGTLIPAYADPLSIKTN